MALVNFPFVEEIIMSILNFGFIKLSPGWTLIYLISVSMLMYIDSGSIAGLIPTLKDELGISDAEAGLLGTTYTLGLIVLNPVFGYFVQHVRVYSLMTIGIFIYVGSLVMAGISVNYWMLLAARFITGIGEASFENLSGPIIVQKAPEARKGLWLSLYYACSPIGVAIGYFYGAVMGNSLGWHWNFLIGSIAILPLLVLTVFIHKEPGLLGQKDSSTYSLSQQILAVLKNPVFMFTTLGCASINFTGGGLGFWLVDYLNNYYGVSQSVAAGISGAVIVIPGLIGVLLGSTILDFRTRKDVKSKQQGLISETDLQRLRIKKSIQFCLVVVIIGMTIGLIGSVVTDLYVFLVCLALSVAILYM